MTDCMIVGDSIAVGTHMFYTECQLYAKGGINTWQWNRMWNVLSDNADKAVISLGTNDHSGVNTLSGLREVRKKIKARKVYWILPYGNSPASNISIADIQAAVRHIAAENKDTVIEITSVQPDKIHPSWSGYKDIVRKVKEDE